MHKTLTTKEVELLNNYRTATGKHKTLILTVAAKAAFVAKQTFLKG